MNETEPQSDAVAEVGRLKRFIKPGLNLLALVFVVLAAKDMVERWEGSRVHVDPVLAGLAALPLVVSCLAQGFAWISLTERMAHHELPKLPAFELYLRSQLARYTPGKVGLPLVRIEGAASLGVTKTVVGVSVFVESLSWTATGAVVGFAFLWRAGPASGLGALFGDLSLPAFAVSVLGLGALLVVDRKRYPGRLRAVLAPVGSGPVVPVGLPAWQLGYWLLVAAHGYLMTRALGAPADAGLTAMGFYVLASVAGFVVLAAPGGLGVREAVLLAGLSPAVGAAGALGGVVLSRAFSLVAEIVVWLLARGLTRSPRAS